jgi:hypothetical protein
MQDGADGRKNASEKAKFTLIQKEGALESSLPSSRRATQLVELDLPVAVAAAAATGRRSQSICVRAGTPRLRLGVGPDVSCGLVVGAEQCSV